MTRNMVGPPVRGENFFGRESLVDLIWQKLQAGHVLLAAPRRFGKTSIMYRLLDEPRWGYRLVHADLEHLTEPAELITQLVAQLATHSHLSRVASRLSYFPRTLWSRFQRSFEEVELLKLRSSCGMSCAHDGKKAARSCFGWWGNRSRAWSSFWTSCP